MAPSRCAPGHGLDQLRTGGTGPDGAAIQPQGLEKLLRAVNTPLVQQQGTQGRPPLQRSGGTRWRVVRSGRAFSPTKAASSPQANSPSPRSGHWESRVFSSSVRTRSADRRPASPAFFLRASAVALSMAKPSWARTAPPAASAGRPPGSGVPAPPRSEQAGLSNLSGRRRGQSPLRPAPEPWR